jgi:cytochrome c553
MTRGARLSTGHAVPVLAMMAVCAFASPAWSQQAAQTPQPAPLVGNAAHGKAISYTCLGCHGIDGYKNAYPNYSVPELEGQHPEYLADALHGYRDGDRAHLTMHSQASTLSDQDILDIATYFAGKPLTATGKPAGGVPKAATLCVSCHGTDGIGITPNYPSLAGQHEDYLVRALDEYKKGGRKNPIMKGFASNLTDEDIDVIAGYFSQLKPSLATEERPYTRFTVH